MTRSKIMQSNSRLRRSLTAAIVSVAALLAVAASAQAEEPFGFQPGSAGFSTNLSTHQAGAHPNLRTKFKLNINPDGSPASGTPKDLNIVLPKGLIGAPAAAPTCPIRRVIDFEHPCPLKDAVGRVTANLYYGFPFTLAEAVYSVNPYPGEPAAFAFNAIFPVRIDTYIRPDGDYGVTVSTLNLTEAANVVGADLTLWGIPADHNGPGTEIDMNTQRYFGGPSGEARIPFLTNPTQCSETSAISTATVDSWQHPGIFASTEAPLGAITGCNQLEFEPSIDVKPTTNLAGAPSGLEFGLHVPQNSDPDGFAAAHLRDAVVTLPEGMTVNPASANGLGACSLAQLGMSAAGKPNGSPVECPDASKLGTVQAVSPALDHPLPGTVYLARQGENPFGSLLALYLVIDDPVSGILVKLAGKVEPDPTTGRLTVSFKENPQLPVEDLELSFFPGPRAALKTPAACGKYTTSGTFVPWSSPEAPDATASSTFELAKGPTGGACLPTGGSAPNTPGFSAGTIQPTAGASSPFVFKVTRNDGSQQLKTIDTTLPKGLLAKLAGVPYCSESAIAAAAGRAGRAEQSSPSCPAASQVGTVNVGAGVGSNPLYVSGKAYLAGPYKGAPLSLAIVTPAVAGPFDLGNVVVRVALNVDPVTAQVHAVSDPIPTILQGIPLEVRSVAMDLDRPDFVLNPTSCAASSVVGSATSVFGQAAPLSQRFQVGDCNRLGFKPKLALKLKGGTKRAGHPALTATLTARPGDANIAATVVALPRSEFLAQNHIRTICTRVQYSADACPPAAVYGFARAFSPLLDKPLEGPVYLRSSDHELPDLVAALKGQIDIDLVGRIDTPKKGGGIRTSFESVPDAPVSKFVLSMQGGKKGLLENSRNICRSKGRANVAMTAQNGAKQNLRPVLGVSCKGGKAKKHGGKHGHKH